MITSHETESDYTSFFSSLKEISKLENLELKPKWIAIDACYASANAIKNIFPDCQIVMCYFHLEEVHIQPEVTAKKRGRPKKESIPSCLEQSPQKKKVLTGKLVKFTSRK